MDTTIPTQATFTEQRPVRAYLQRVKILLFSPGRFFREEFPSFSLSDSLTFGLVSGWISAGLAFMVETLNSLLLVSLFDSWVQKIFESEESFSILGLSGSSFIWSAGFLMVFPFLALVRLLFSSMVVFTFAKLFIDEDSEPVAFRTIFSLRACAFGGQWFSIVPIFGTPLAFVANLVLLIAGLRERFRISNRRAAAVVLAPYFFLFLASMLFMMLMIFAFSQLPFEELFDLRATRFGP